MQVNGLTSEVALTADEYKSLTDGPKITGYISRDFDGTLTFNEDEPFRGPEGPEEQYKRYWLGDLNLELPKEYFPNLSWYDEPMEVSLMITTI